MAENMEDLKNKRNKREVIHFTQKTIEGLSPKEKPYIVRDDENKGLILKIYPSGTKTFFLDVLVERKHEMFKLGTWPDMNIATVREKILATRASLVQGKNPKVEKKEGISLGEFFKIYMKRHGEDKKSFRKDRARFDLHLKAWELFRLQDVNRSKIESLHREIGNKTPVQANRVLQLLSSIFSKAILWGYFKGENPCKGIKKFREISRDRFLSGEELGRFFESLELTESPIFKDYILMSLLTGARKSNVLAMKWGDIDFGLGLWRVPGEFSKNGSPMQVPLVPDALELLRRRRSETSSVFVFEGQGSTGHYAEPRHAWETLLKRAKLDNLRPHDLRRSLGSWMTIGGASLPVVGKALGHKSQQATQVYARLDLDPVRAAMTQAVEAMTRNRKKAT